MHSKQEKNQGLNHWAFSMLRRPSFTRFLVKLKRLGLLPREDGWRTATQAYLRAEHTKFILVAFRLNFWSDEPSGKNRNFDSATKHIIQRLALFLKDHPLTYGKLLWGTFMTRIKKNEPLDIVCADFNEDGTLRGIQPYFDQDRSRFHGLTEEDAKRLNELMMDVYNRLLPIRDDDRPRRLKAELKKGVLAWSGRSKREADESLSYLERILNSLFIHFETLSSQESDLGLSRFKYPDFIRCKHPGFGVMNIRCRLTADFSEADLWCQISHVAMDGVPVQDILKSLKSQWKTCGDIVLPSPAQVSSMTAPVRCTTETGKNALYFASRIIRFRPLLEAREALNAFYAGKLQEPITLVSMLGWGLAHHPLFLGRKFLFPVDLPSVHPGERTLGFVSIRPSHYIRNTRYQDAFLAYQQEFRRKLSRAGTRISGIYKLFEVFSLMPPFMYWFVQRFMKNVLSKLLGTIVITMIKGADYFIAPSSDVILGGFIAIGNGSLPAEDKTTAGWVSAKSTQGDVCEYLAAVEQVAADFASTLEDPLRDCVRKSLLCK